MSTTEQNKASVTAFFKALSKGDVEHVVNAYADDGAVTTMGDTLISGTTGKDGIAASVAGIMDVFPRGLTFTVQDMVAEGEKVAVEASCLGEHISGKTYNNQYHFLFEFRDGKLLNLTEYMDTELVTDVLCSGQRPPFDD